MTTNFPTSVDAFTNPTSANTLDNPPHDQQHADINDAMEAVQTSLLDGSPLKIDDANNRVGIGTTSPSVPLHVSSTGAEGVRIQKSNNDQQGSYIGFYDDNARLGYVGYAANDDLYLENEASAGNTFLSTGGTIRMTIDSSGNVGINDTTPSYTLDVNGDINAQGYTRSKGKKLGMALIHEGGLSGGTSTFLGTFNGDWLNYRIVVDAAQNGSGGWTFFRFVNSSNNAIQSGYYTAYFLNGGFNRQNGQSAAVAIYSEYFAYGGMVMDITMPYQGDNPSLHVSSAGHDVNGGQVHSLWAHGYCATTSDITGFQFYNGSPYGSVKVYGY